MRKNKTLSIIKRRDGRSEKFDERKVYASIYSACLSSHVSEQGAEKIADKTCKSLKKWMRGKKTLSSTQIFDEVTRLLSKSNKDAAFMYETHMDIG